MHNRENMIPKLLLLRCHLDDFPTRFDHIELDQLIVLFPLVLDLVKLLLVQPVVSLLYNGLEDC